MNRFRNLTAFFAFALLILGLPTVATAQWGNNRNDDYYGNGGYRNGSYNRNLQGTIKNLKNRSKQFERRIDRELDSSRYDGRRREDRVLQLAQDFKEATERLDSAYDNRRDYSRSQDEARRVLDLGSQLDRVISRLRLSSNVSSDWSRIRQDLDVLRNSYNYSGNRRGNRNGDYDDDDYYRNDRNRRNGDYDDDDDYNRNNRNNRNRRSNSDWRRNFPFPLPF